MITKINDLLGRVEAFAPTTAAEVEEFRIKILGKKGELTALMDEFKSVPAEQKRELGQKINALKQAAQARINELKATLQSSAVKSEAIDDMTRPGSAEADGTRHPISIVKNQIVTLDVPLSNEALLKLNMLLNTTLTGMALEEINLGLVARLKEQAGIHSEILGSVIDAVAKLIQVNDDMEIYTSGTTNIFKYPELSDKESAQEIISAFEEKQQLAALVSKTMARGDNKDIQVYIGNETDVEKMKDCSVVTATYELGEGLQGTIGIIGPKRMDYEHVMKTLKTLMAELDDIFHRNE